MKYQWVEEIKTCEQLGQELGCKVKSITKGNIVIGYENTTNGNGKPYQREITRKGIEIEFEKEPTAEQLAKLDLMLPELKRGGGKSLYEEIDALKAKITELEKKAK